MAPYYCNYTIIYGLKPWPCLKSHSLHILLYSILFYSTVFFTILIYSILFYSILFFSKVEDRGEFIIHAENHYGVTEEPVFLNVQPVPKDLPRYTSVVQKARNTWI